MNKKIVDDILSSKTDDSVYRVNEDIIDYISSLSEPMSLHIVGKNTVIQSKEELFMALKNTILLDDLHSYSWDALDECLYLDAYENTTIIALYNLHEYIKNDPKGFGILVDIFKKNAIDVKLDYQKIYRLLIVEPFDFGAFGFKGANDEAYLKYSN